MSRYSLNVNGKVLEVSLIGRQGSLLSFVVDGESYQVDVKPLLEERATQTKLTTPVPPTPTSRNISQSGSPNDIRAPMPGIIVHIPLKENDKVKMGETLIVMEAMKMENNISSPRAGTIKKIHVKIGEEVENARVLVTLAD